MSVVYACPFFLSGRRISVTSSAGLFRLASFWREGPSNDDWLSIETVCRRHRDVNCRPASEEALIHALNRPEVVHSSILLLRLVTCGIWLARRCPHYGERAEPALSIRIGNRGAQFLSLARSFAERPPFLVKYICVGFLTSAVAIHAPYVNPIL
ncbi:hypothetical protein IEO21_08366 [Rhodonia placenta]|uniref:Uncharacterized protein n=1 Tax=Rhodonia placenta TaxID=104341 RepID=A0A8H7NWJ3_9APHY|nr:hypothetical protein IEO21_08366 [Postia placenta]